MDSSKWLSRKWLLGMAGLILGLLVLVGIITPDQEDTWIVVAEKVVGAALAIASVLGYVVVEGRVDEAREDAKAKV